MVMLTTRRKSTQVSPQKRFDGMARTAGRTSRYLDAGTSQHRLRLLTHTSRQQNVCPKLLHESGKHPGLMVLRMRVLRAKRE